MLGGLGPIRAVRRQVEAERDTARSDVARELSIAITHLEDAEIRMARALVRQSRGHRADADQALNRATDKVAELSVGPEAEPTEQKED